METDSLLVVTPTYREAENISTFLRRLRQACPWAHCLVVNDESGDGLPDIIRSDEAFGQRVHLLERPAKLGLGSAYTAGFRWALENNYQWVAQMDADLQHDPHALADMLSKANAADLVVGSRYVGGVRVLNWPVSRLVISVLAAQYVRLLTGLPVTDPTGGIKLWSAELLRRIDLDQITSTGYAFQIETTHAAWLCGATITEVPITFEGRNAGQSKMSGRIVREAICRVPLLALRGFFNRWLNNSRATRKVG